MTFLEELHQIRREEQRAVEKAQEEAERELQLRIEEGAADTLQKAKSILRRRAYFLGAPLELCIGGKLMAIPPYAGADLLLQVRSRGEFVLKAKRLLEDLGPGFEKVPYTAAGGYLLCYIRAKK